MINGIIGYDSGEIIKLKATVERMALEISSNITTIFLNEFVIPMGSIWYSPEAVQWFKGPFISMLESLETPYERYFQNYLINIQLAADTWVSSIGNQHLKVSPLSVNLKKTFNNEIVANVIEHNIKSQDSNGNTGMDIDRATFICTVNFPKIKTLIENEINSYTSKIDTTNAFLGENQAVALKNLFLQLGDLINNLFSMTLEGGNSLPTTINKYIEKYKFTTHSITKSINDTVLTHQNVTPNLNTSNTINSELMSPRISSPQGSGAVSAINSANISINTNMSSNSAKQQSINTSNIPVADQSNNQYMNSSPIFNKKMKNENSIRLTDIYHDYSIDDEQISQQQVRNDNNLSYSDKNTNNNINDVKTSRQQVPNKNTLNMAENNISSDTFHDINTMRITPEGIVNNH